MLERDPYREQLRTPVARVGYDISWRLAYAIIIPFVLIARGVLWITRRSKRGEP